MMEEVERNIGYEFKNKELLRQALTHSSATEGREPDNERLEFLGDSVLSLIVAHRLYLEHPQMDEGDMTLMRARIVETNSLADAAKKLKLTEFFKIGGPLQDRAIPPRILSGLFEAVLGAIFLDGGLDCAEGFVVRHLGSLFSAALSGSACKDYKSLLQEWTQRNFNGRPSYKTVAEKGPPHSRLFEVSVSLMDEILGIGSGKSKKEAEQAAAKEALLKLNKIGMGRISSE
ncbi:MAG: ribonuclease III [Planctomycetota bacterium]|nr:ribonuclease III [Planctomycetota bacterium]